MSTIRISLMMGEYRAMSMMSVILAGDAHAALLQRVVPRPCTRVKSRAAFMATTARGGAVGFVDSEFLYQVDKPSVPVIAIIECAPAEMLGQTLRLMGAFPWLSNVIAAAMLGTPQAARHIQTLIDRIEQGPAVDMLGAPGIGRVALLARASRREARFARMHEFFAERGLPERTIAAIDEISEELVMNALYNAPVEAGYLDRATLRTEDIELPPERACEISYGMDDDSPFVRVRDTFGALSRTRLLTVLDRCSKDGVTLDVSRGGAGLGMWRVFASASTLALTVIPGRVTDILVKIDTSGRRKDRRLLALHLFFGVDPNGWMDSVNPTENQDLFDQSITLMLA